MPYRIKTLEIKNPQPSTKIQNHYFISVGWAVYQFYSQQQQITKTSDSCVFLFTFFSRVTYCSVTSLQVPTTHSEEINLKAKKGSWTATTLAHKMINVDETGEPFSGSKQCHQSVLVSVWLETGLQRIQRKCFVWRRELLGTLCSVRIYAGTQDSSGSNSQRRKMVDLLFTKSPDTCCSCQCRVWTP